MSRDDASRPERDAERASVLLAAYVDGVAELSPEERREVEARLACDPEARADGTAVRDLLGRLRDLPPEGVEPDWTQMARSIRDTVGDEVPRPWWRRWRWLVPLTAAATVAVVMVAIVRKPQLSTPSGAELDASAGTASTATAPTDERASEDTVALWLDGNEVDVDPSAVELLAAPAAELALDDPALPDGAGDVDEVGLLPASNLAWLDSLDDDAIGRAERWLDGSTAPASPPSGPNEPNERKKG